MSTTPLDEIAADVQAYLELGRQIKALQETQKHFRLSIENAIGDHEVGTLAGDPVISYKYVKSTRFDQAAFKKDHPELVASYSTVTESRRLTGF